MSSSAYTRYANLTCKFRFTFAQLSFAVAMVITMLATSMNVAHAQEAYAVGFESTVVYSGLNAPGGVAVDKLGNIYIANYADNDVIMEALQINGTYTPYYITGSASNPCTTPPACLSAPYGVAVDSNLNVYIADTSNHRVLEEVPTGTPGVFTQSTIMASGNPYITNPTGIAVDATGNVYVTDPNTFNVIKLTAGTWAVTLVANSASTGLQDPNGVVVDGNQNIFIADVLDGVIEIPSTCSFPASSGCTVTIGSGILSPKGVAVDSQNNLYIASTGNQQLIKETVVYCTTGGPIEPCTNNSGFSQSTVQTNLTSLDAVAVDPNFNIYVGLPSSDQVIEISPVDGNFGEVNIGSSSPVLSLTFQFLTGGQIGNILAVQKGATNSDFNVVSGGTCIIGQTYDTGATCTVNVQFTPLYAGTRYGAVELINSNTSPALFATAYIYGTGMGSQIVFLPGVENYIYGNFGDQAVVAVDGNDNIYAASQSVPYVYELTAASGYTDSIQFPGSYGTKITDIAVDGAGDVYITESGAGMCFKYFAADNFQTVIAIDSSVDNPDGTAVDGEGNVYVGSQLNGYVHEVLAATDYTQIIKVYTTTHQLSDIAVDGANDLYLLNYDNGSVTQVMAVDGAIPASPVVNNIITGLDVGCCNGLQTIRVDNQGNVYVVDDRQNSIVEYYVASNFTTSENVFPFTAASGLAIDGQGNMWASASSTDWIGELSTSAPPTLYFNTAVGTPSAAQDVYVKNIGNETLTFPVEGSGNNPSISQYYSWTQTGSTTLHGNTYPDCPDATSSPQTLTVDSVCGFPIIFDPLVSGAIDGSLVLTDSALGASGASQTVLLFGNAPPPTMTVTADSYTIGTNGPIPTFYYTENGVLGSADCSGTPHITTTLTGGTPYATGVYPIIITAGTFTCNSAYATPVVFVNGTLTVGKNSAQLTLTTTNATMAYGQPVPNLSADYTLTGFQGTDSFGADCTGAPSITTVATSASAPGTYQISADNGTLVCSSANYTYTINVVNSGILTITKDTPTISWAPTPSTIATGTGLTAGQLDALAMDGTTNVSSDGNFVYTYHNGSTNPVITAGYVLPLGSDLICVVWTPVSPYTTDFNATAAPTANCTTIVVTNKSILTMTAGSPAAITYGANPTSLYSYTTSPSTLPAGCTVGTVTYTLTPTPVSITEPEVGSYAITPAGITCTGGSGYVVSFATGTLTVNQDTPNFTYTSSALTYPATLSTITSTQTNSNPIGTNVSLGGTITSYTWNGASKLGTFAPTAGTGTLCEIWTPSTTIDVTGVLTYADEYNPTASTCETVTVTEAVTVTASAVNITYGATPSYTYTTSPSVTLNSSNCSTYPPTYTLSPVPAYSPIPVGTYTITPSGLVCNHYTFTYATGTLTVSKDTPALAYTSSTLTYGAALSGIGSTVTNLNNSSNVTADGTLTYYWNGTLEPSTFTPPAGTGTLCEVWSPDTSAPPTLAGGAYNAQYNSTTTYPPGTCETVTVNPEAITVTASAVNITYGQTPTYTYTTSPSVTLNGSDCTTFTPTYTLTPSTAYSPIPVGSYTITPSGLVCSNYSFTYATGTLTVSKDTPVLAYTSSTLTYGAALSGIGSTVTNLNNSSNVTADGTLTYYWNGTLEPSTFTPPAGTGTLCEVWSPDTSAPPTLAGGAYNAQYNSTTTYPPGTCETVTVNPEAITVTASAVNITYGQTPSYTYTTSPSVTLNSSNCTTYPPTYTLTPSTAYSPIPVGSYTITPSGLVCSNYTFTYATGTLTVSKDTPVLAYTSSTLTYGAALSGIGSTVTNLNNSSNVTADGTLTYYWNGTLEPSTFTPPAGTGTLCEVWSPDTSAPPTLAGGAYNAQYNSTTTYPPGTCETVTVNPEAITVTASAVNITYGQTPTYTYTTSPSVTLNGSDCTTFTPTYTLSPVPAYSPIPVGSYTITPSGLVCSNYSFTYATGTLTVSKDTPVLAYTSSTLTYGAALSGIGSTVTNLNNSSNVTADGTLTYYWNGTLEPSTFTPPAGTGTLCEVWSPDTSAPPTLAGGAYNAQYNSTTTYPPGTCETVTVNPEAITVTASAVNITYGQTPTYTYTTSPSVTLNSSNCSTYPPTYTLTPSTSYSPIPVGIYTITPSGLVCSNYSFTYATGTLTVSKDTPVLAYTSSTLTYGAALSGIGSTVTNLNNSSNVTADGTLTYYWNGTLEPSTFTPPAGTGTLCEVWSPDTSAPPTLAGGAYNAQYNSTTTYPPGTCETVTVNPEAITVTASAVNITYGQTPTYTYTTSPSVTLNGSDCTTFTPTYTLSPVPAYSPIPAGSYTITPSGLVCSNYSFTYATGTLTVSKDTPVLAYSGSTSITYGAALSTLTSTVTNLNNSANVTADGTLTYYWNGTLEPSTFTPPAGTGTLCEVWSPDGTTPPTLAGGAYSAQYNSTTTYPPGTCETVTVSAEAITVTANAVSITYGQTPTYTYTTSPSVTLNSSNCSTYPPTYTLSPSAAYSPIPVGSYTITPSGLVCSNYSFTYATGTLTVAQDTPVLAYTGSSTITYGVALSSITSTVTNLNNSVDVTADGTLTYYWNGTLEPSTFTPPVGSGSGTLCEVWTPYGTTPPTLDGGAYSAQYNSTTTYPPGTCETVTVNQATGTLKLKTTDSTMVYGSAVPDLSSNFTLTGFIGSDTQAICTGAPTISTTATSTSPASPPTYPITAVLNTLVCSSANATYTINIVNGGLMTITKATNVPLVLTSTNDTVPYGTPFPNVQNDYTLTGFIGGDTQGTVCTGMPSLGVGTSYPAPVGHYPIVVSIWDLTCNSRNASYTITAVSSGQLYVTEVFNAPLTLTTTNQTITYGTTPYVDNDYTLSGFLGGDTQALVCSGIPDITTTGTATSPVGPYPITYQDAGTLVCGSGNATYVISTINNPGILTIVDETGTGSGPVNFGSVPVNTTSGPVTVTFTFSNTGVIGSTTVLTTGISGLDFADAGGGTCDTNGPSHVYNSGDTCTMILTFTPEYPGQRIGAVELLDGDGNIAASALLAGIGTGPATDFYIYNGSTNLPATVTTVGSGFTKPTGLTVDGQGDVFITDATANTVSEVTAASGYTTVTPIGSGFNGPTGIVIDGAGNIFVADSGNNAVKEIVADGGYTVVKTLYSTPGNAPGGLALDASGNLFITYPSSSSSQLVELTAASGYTTHTVVVNTSFTDAGGIAVDNSGNLWVTDTGNGSLDEVVYSGSSYASTPTVFNSSLTVPTGIALDSNGNAYIDQGGATSVTELAAPAYSVASSFGSITGGVYYGVALDGAGDIFAIDGTSNTVEKLNYSVAPTLTFPSTAYGSTNGPQTVTLVNYGNTQLTLPIPSSGNDGAITSNFTFASGTAPECPLVTSSSSNPGTLNASTSCTLPISFAPLALGPLTGTLTLTDNNLNIAGATQVINLNGTGTQATNVPLTLTTTSISLPYGSQIPSVAGDYTLTGFVPGDSAANCTGSPSLSTTATSVPPSPVGAYPITATITGFSCSSSNATYVITAVNSGNVNITQTTPVITWTPASIVYGQGLTAAQLDAQAFAGIANFTNVSGDGTFAYTYLGNSITLGSILPFGSDTICVVFTPSSGYTLDLTATAPPPANCVVLNVTAAPLTITATATASAIYNTAFPVFTYTISGFVSPDGSGVLTNDNNASFGGANVVCSGLPTLSTPATVGSNVGIYTINVSTSGFTCNGYTFLINTGELHINKATLSIQPVSASQVYDGQVLSYNWTCSFTDPTTHVTTVLGTNTCGGGAYQVANGPTIDTSATIRASKAPGPVYYTSNVGVYALNAYLGSLQSVSGNFNFTFPTGSTLTLTTNPGSLTVQPNNVTVKQATCISAGGPALTYKINGLLNWDTQATTTTGAPALSVPTAAQSCTKGTYTITAGQGTLQLDQYGGVYDYTFVPTSGFNLGTATLIID